jgi:NAD(P)H dehydrogenase (quinone)
MDKGNRVLVLYDSASGNTAKMAELVAEGAAAIDGLEVRLRSVDQATAADVVWCDGLAVGSPTNMGLMSWKMKKFWDETMADQWMKVDGKIACAFSSSGGWGGGSELACQSILTVLMNFGFLVFGVTDYVSKLMTLHYGAVTAREPRSDEAKDSCRKLGKRLAEWVTVFAGRRNDQHPLLKHDERLLPGQE